MAKTKHTDIIKIKTIAHAKMKDIFIHLHVVLNSDIQCNKSKAYPDHSFQFIKSEWGPSRYKWQKKPKKNIIKCIYYDI